MKSLIIVAVIALGAVNMEEVCQNWALVWAEAHNLPVPTATCVVIKGYTANCDVTSRGHVYPLRCYATPANSADTKLGCYLRTED